MSKNQFFSDPMDYEESHGEEEVRIQSPEVYDKDLEIENQEKNIKEMRKQFANTIETMRKQLSELVAESTIIQKDMLNRIKELKEELDGYRKPVKKQPGAQHVKGASKNKKNGTPSHPRKLASKADEDLIRDT